MMIWVFAIVVSIMAGVGVAGRGKWSVSIAGISSLCVILVVGYSFFADGLIHGFGMMIVVLAIYRVTDKLFRKMIGTNKRPSHFDMYEENRKARKELDVLMKMVRKKSVNSQN